MKKAKIVVTGKNKKLKAFIDKNWKKLEVLAEFPEMLDFLDVIEYGAPKHGYDNWLKPDGKTMSYTTNFNSMSHHLADYYCHNLIDKDSGLHPLLHLQCRAAMGYVRHARMIIHADDVTKWTSWLNKPVVKIVKLDDSKCITQKQAEKRYRGKTGYYYSEEKKK